MAGIEANKICEHCEAPAKLQCGACELVWIEDTQSALGRQLRTARDVKQGDLIISAPPCVIGPRLDYPKPSCLGCHVILDEKMSLCEGGCEYPLCSSECHRKFHSEEECTLLEKIKSPDKRCEIVTILRFALLKKSNPRIYEKLILLEDHVDEIKASSTRWKNIEEGVLKHLKEIKSDLDIEEDQELERLVGIWITNSFELERTDQQLFGEKRAGESIQGLYDVPSLMNHSCVGNARLVINSGMYIDVYAAVPISNKAPITFNYISPLEDYDRRQKILKENKFFECKCERCEDPTELGTFSSSLLCQVCKKSPSTRTKDSKNYECRDCSEVMSERDAMKIANSLMKGKNSLHRIGKAWTHTFIIEIKMTLVHLIRSNAAISQMDENVQDIIDPGMSLGRGLVLHELHAARVFLANYRFENMNAEKEEEPSQEDKMELLMSLYDALENLMESWKCLFVEPKESAIGQQTQNNAWGNGGIGAIHCYENLTKCHFVSRLALVTGAAGGIGQSICRVLSREGCSVIGTRMNTEKEEDVVLSACVHDLKDQKHASYTVDVSNAGEVKTLFFRRLKGVWKASRYYC
ncbi:SMYD [Lepeophtheirus salmonis]|uniref:SMYD n=1 Tax=Lepeophtheirus salmonis TaxID=72036 RepID=A0A7R8H0D9_LEPSM|nr:SMYD [Lepeophtheirus salmonis]CAF2782506.1 SMYD [Lepeophtheirus salmonis]